MKLSICIATFKRGLFIGQTLESICAQIEPEVEIVILDGGSPDNTAEVVAGFVARFPCVRYIRELTNSGIDQDYDKAVLNARGEFCWLMTDDDLLFPGAISRLMKALDGPQDLVIVNASVFDTRLEKVLCDRLLNIQSDREYGAGEVEEFFVTAANYLSFIGGVVIRKSAWEVRDRSSYFGTLFIHIGVIFQAPNLSGVAVIAEPAVMIRYGNAMWTPRSFEIWMFIWPKLVWSFQHFSEHSRALVSAPEPWRKLKKLGVYRAIGGYSIREFRIFFQDKFSWRARVLPYLVARTPGSLANLTSSIFCLLFFRNKMRLHDLAQSTHSTFLARMVSRGVR